MAVVYQQEMQSLAKRIKLLRKARGLTVQEVAFRCDMERSNLSRLEAGAANPTLKTLCTICSALDVTLADLFR